MFMTLTELRIRGFVTEPDPYAEPLRNAKGDELPHPYWWTDDYKAAVDYAIWQSLTARRHEGADARRGISIPVAEYTAVLNNKAAWTALIQSR